MALPESAESYWFQQQAINAAAVAVAVRSWQVSAGNPARWLSGLPVVISVIKHAQTAAALLVPRYVDTALGELSINAEPVAAVDPTPLIGRSGSGLPLQDLYAQLPTQLAIRVDDALAVSRRDDVRSPQPTSSLQNDIRTDLDDFPSTTFRDAMKATELQLQSHVQTAISDAGRAAESLEIAVRPGVGYVRMLNPPSCKRCVVLAGKFYRWNAGFQRHPKCDCRHVPADESAADDLRVHPEKYFRSLRLEEQDATFGKAGARAVRDGADLAQVVNADQGMQVAQVYGRNLKITTQGVTKRGRAGRAIRARGRNAATTPRLMPSSIYEIADDRNDAIRLLRLNGYIADSAAGGVVDLDAVIARSSA